MKNKFIPLLLLAAVACHTSEITPLVSSNDQLIRVTPSTVFTKSAIDGTVFPDDRTFLMSAYYNASEGTSCNYFTEIPFAKDGSSWTADKYWPQTGSLDLLAVSHDGITPTAMQWGENVSTSLTATYPDNSTTQSDILFAIAKEKNSKSNACPLTFKHAEALTIFTAKTGVAFDASANTGITIDRIKLNGVYNSGTLTITDTSGEDGYCVWSDLGNKEDIYLKDKTTSKDSLYYNVPTTAMSISSAGNGLGVGGRGILIPEQAQTSFTVFFTIHNGKDASNNNLNSSQQYTYLCAGNWKEGKKYTYCLNMDLHGINVIPSIEDWTTETNDIEIGQTPTLKLTSSLSNIINEGGDIQLTFMNTLSDTDTISFTMNCDWLAFKSKSDVVNNQQTFTFNATANTVIEERSTNITFSNGADATIIAVSQNAAAEIFTIDKNSSEIIYGIPLIVGVTTNNTYSVTTTADWLTITEGENDLWNIEATGLTETQRQAVVTFKSAFNTERTLTVTQRKVDKFKVTCSPTNKSFDCQANTLNIVITANTSYTITYEGDFLSQNTLSGNNLVVNVSANDSEDLREGAVVFNYKDNDGNDKQFRCFVTQYGIDNDNCYLTATYGVVNAGNTKILNSATPVSKMYVDGNDEPIAPTNYYNFATTGNHTVKFVLKNSTRNLGSMFIECNTLTYVDGTHMTWEQISDATWMFNSCNRLTLVEGLENWVIKNDYKVNPGYIIISMGGIETFCMFQSCSAYQHLELPQSTMIESFMINHLSSIDNTSITIPASVKTIGGGHTFYNTGRDGVFKEFIVAPGNAHFKTINGALYSMDGTEFVACPRSPVVTDRTFEIAEGVTKLGELCFNREQVFDKLVLPDSYTIAEYTSGDRGGGINYGNSLSVALYCYTSVNEYSVKDTNPRYIAYDGCIYSKDGTHLIAVPKNKTGIVTVKDGCTHINREAFWYDALMQTNVAPLCSGVSIPASVTSIEANQITGLNNMVTVKGWTITIDPDNAVYTTDANGKIIKK